MERMQNSSYKNDKNFVEEDHSPDPKTTDSLSYKSINKNVSEDRKQQLTDKEKLYKEILGKIRYSEQEFCEILKQNNSNTYEKLTHQIVDIIQQCIHIKDAQGQYLQINDLQEMVQYILSPKSEKKFCFSSVKNDSLIFKEGDLTDPNQLSKLVFFLMFGNPQDNFEGGLQKIARIENVPPIISKIIERYYQKTTSSEPRFSSQNNQKWKQFKEFTERRRVLIEKVNTLIKQHGMDKWDLLLDILDLCDFTFLENERLTPKEQFNFKWSLSGKEDTRYEEITHLNFQKKNPLRDVFSTPIGYVETSEITKVRHYEHCNFITLCLKFKGERVLSLFIDGVNLFLRLCGFTNSEIKKLWKNYLTNYKNDTSHTFAESISASESQNIEVMTLLIPLGLPITNKAIGAAIRNNNYRMVKLLFDSGANPRDVKDLDGNIMDLGIYKKALERQKRKKEFDAEYIKSIKIAQEWEDEERRYSDSGRQASGKEQEQNQWISDIEESQANQEKIQDPELRSMFLGEYEWLEQLSQQHVQNRIDQYMNDKETDLGGKFSKLYSLYKDNANNEKGGKIEIEKQVVLDTFGEKLIAFIQNDQTIQYFSQIDSGSVSSICSKVTKSIFNAWEDLFNKHFSQYKKQKEIRELKKQDLIFLNQELNKRNNLYWINPIYVDIQKMISDLKECEDKIWGIIKFLKGAGCNIKPVAEAVLGNSLESEGSHAQSLTSILDEINENVKKILKQITELKEGRTKFEVLDLVRKEGKLQLKAKEVNLNNEDSVFISKIKDPFLQYIEEVSDMNRLLQESKTQESDILKKMDEVLFGIKDENESKKDKKETSKENDQDEYGIKKVRQNLQFDLIKSENTVDSLSKIVKNVFNNIKNDIKNKNDNIKTEQSNLDKLEGAKNTAINGYIKNKLKDFIGNYTLRIKRKDQTESGQQDSNIDTIPFSKFCVKGGEVLLPASLAELNNLLENVGKRINLNDEISISNKNNETFEFDLWVGLVPFLRNAIKDLTELKVDELKASETDSESQTKDNKGNGSKDTHDLNNSNNNELNELKGEGIKASETASEAQTKEIKGNGSTEDKNLNNTQDEDDSDPIFDYFCEAMNRFDFDLAIQLIKATSTDLFGLWIMDPNAIDLFFEAIRDMTGGAYSEMGMSDRQTVIDNFSEYIRDYKIQKYEDMFETNENLSKDNDIEKIDHIKHKNSFYHKINWQKTLGFFIEEFFYEQSRPTPMQSFLAKLQILLLTSRMQNSLVKDFEILMKQLPKEITQNANVKSYLEKKKKIERLNKELDENIFISASIDKNKINSVVQDCQRKLAEVNKSFNKVNNAFKEVDNSSGNRVIVEQIKKILIDKKESSILEKKISELKYIDNKIYDINESFISIFNTQSGQFCDEITKRVLTPYIHPIDKNPHFTLSQMDPLYIKMNNINQGQMSNVSVSKNKAFDFNFCSEIPQDPGSFTLSLKIPIKQDSSIPICSLSLVDKRDGVLFMPILVYGEEKNLINITLKAPISNSEEGQIKNLIFTLLRLQKSPKTFKIFSDYILKLYKKEKTWQEFDSLFFQEFTSNIKGLLKLLNAKYKNTHNHIEKTLANNKSIDESELKRQQMLFLSTSGTLYQYYLNIASTALDPTSDHLNRLKKYRKDGSDLNLYLDKITSILDLLQPYPEPSLPDLFNPLVSFYNNIDQTLSCLFSARYSCLLSDMDIKDGEDLLKDKFYNSLTQIKSKIEELCSTPPAELKKNDEGAEQPMDPIPSVNNNPSPPDNNGSDPLKHANEITQNSKNDLLDFLIDRASILESKLSQESKDCGSYKDDLEQIFEEEKIIKQLNNHFLGVINKNDNKLFSTKEINWDKCKRFINAVKIYFYPWRKEFFEFCTDGENQAAVIEVLNQQLNPSEDIDFPLAFNELLNRFDDFLASHSDSYSSLVEALKDLYFSEKPSVGSRLNDNNGQWYLTLKSSFNQFSWPEWGLIEKVDSWLLNQQLSNYSSLAWAMAIQSLQLAETITETEQKNIFNLNCVLWTYCLMCNDFFDNYYIQNPTWATTNKKETRPILNKIDDVLRYDWSSVDSLDLRRSYRIQKTGFLQNLNSTNQSSENLNLTPLEMAILLFKYDKDLNKETKILWVLKSILQRENGAFAGSRRTSSDYLIATDLIDKGYYPLAADSICKRDLTTKNEQGRSILFALAQNQNIAKASDQNYGLAELILQKMSRLGFDFYLLDEKEKKKIIWTCIQNKNFLVLSWILKWDYTDYFKREIQKDLNQCVQCVDTTIPHLSENQEIDTEEYYRRIAFFLALLDDNYLPEQMGAIDLKKLDNILNNKLKLPDSHRLRTTSWLKKQDRWLLSSNLPNINNESDNKNLN